MASAQTLSVEDRRTLAVWAADCAEHVLVLFEAENPGDGRPRDAIERARRFGRGESSAAEEIKRRFAAGRAAGTVRDPAAIAAARSAAQAASVAHMGAHALGAAAYAAKAASLAGEQHAAQLLEEIEWQLDRMDPAQQAAIRRLPPLGDDRAGPLGLGLLTSDVLATAIHRIQTECNGPSEA